METGINPNANYTPDEASKLMRTDRHRIYDYIRCGWLKSFKLEANSRRRLISGKALLELVGKLETMEEERRP